MRQIVRENVLVPFGLLITAIALYASTLQQQFSATEAAQSPMFFPRIILALWAVFSLIVLIQALKSKATDSPIASWARIVTVIVATLIYTNVIGTEGFFIPSVIFALICLPIFGIRHPVLIVLFAVLTPAALVFLFNHTLGMPLPTSRFTHIF